MLLVYLLYIGVAIYGCTRSRDGLERENVFREDSYAVEYMKVEDSLFRQFPYTIQVAITGNLEYRNNKTRDRILQLHSDLEEKPFVFKGIFTQSGIRSFYRYLDRNPLVARNISNESEFIQLLRDKLLRGNRNRRAMDFLFDQNFTKIIACRFMIQTYEVNNTNQDRDMMIGLRETAKNYSDLNVTTFTPNYIIFDQYGGVLSAVLQATGIAALAMICISLVFIPKPICSLVVGFSIISIEVGVIGYMSLWSVNLDPISTINLIMCIGFSVDFTSHVAYAYLSSKAASPKEKVQESLFCLAVPIIQGGVSTILCVITLPFMPSYAYVAFFKVVFLVIICAMAHGLFFIPVILALVDRSGNSDSLEPPLSKEITNDKTVSSVTNQENSFNLPSTVYDANACSSVSIISMHGIPSETNISTITVNS